AQRRREPRGGAPGGRHGLPDETVRTRHPGAAGPCAARRRHDPGGRSMSDAFLDGFLDDYYAECEEHLASIRRGLLGLEASIGQPRPDGALVEELFRS